MDVRAPEADGTVDSDTERARAVRASDAVSSRKRRSLAGRPGSASVKSSRLAGDRTINKAGLQRGWLEIGRFGDELNR